MDDDKSHKKQLRLSRAYQRELLERIARIEAEVDGLHDDQLDAEEAKLQQKLDQHRTQSAHTTEHNIKESENLSAIKKKMQSQAATPQAEVIDFSRRQRQSTTTQKRRPFMASPAWGLLAVACGLALVLVTQNLQTGSDPVTIDPELTLKSGTAGDDLPLECQLELRSSTGALRMHQQSYLLPIGKPLYLIGSCAAAAWLQVKIQTDEASSTYLNLKIQGDTEPKAILKKDLTAPLNLNTDLKGSIRSVTIFATANPVAEDANGVTLTKDSPHIGDAAVLWQDTFDFEQVSP